MSYATARHTAAIFTFTERVPSPRRNSFYQHRGGNPLEAVFAFLRLKAELPTCAGLAEAFAAVSPYAEHLFDASEDFGERYRYHYDVAADKVVVTRRKSASDNLCVPRYPLVLGPWFEEFAGTLSQFIATYTHPGIASHDTLRRYGLSTLMPTC